MKKYNHKLAIAYVHRLTWYSSSKLLVKENPRGSRYFTCLTAHIKRSDKDKKLPLLPGIDSHLQGLTTAPIPLTCTVVKFYMTKVFGT